MPTHALNTRPGRRIVAFAAAFVLSLLSCGREITGPDGGLRFAHGFGFLAEFPGPLAEVTEGAGSVVPFERVRVVLRRADGGVALDRLVEFPSNADSVALDLSIPISSGAPASGEPLALTLSYIDAAGDTVFRGGPVQVLAVPSQRGAPPPPPVPVPLTYHGPGADAVAVRILPETLTVVAGDPFTFAAQASNAQQQPVPSAPIVHLSRDTTRARLTTPAGGAGTGGPQRGNTYVVAALVTGVAVDSAVLVVTPRPGALQLVSGGAQVAPAGAPLPDPVRVRLVATDGGSMTDVPLTVAVTGGGGSITPLELVTDDAGEASFAWTLGDAGPQAATVSSAGVTALNVTATAGDPPLVPTQLGVVQQPGPQLVVGVPPVTGFIVSARDANGVPVPGFTDSVTIAFGENPASATLGGTLRVAAVGGVATFDAFTVSAQGSGFTLVASAAGLTSITSETFEVGSGGPAVLTVIAGDEQHGYVDQPVADPIVVQVTDGGGAPLEGISVTFAVTAGGGSLTGAVATTNAAGHATLGSWTLGPTPGANALSATVSGLAPVTITATAILPPPQIVLSVFGSNVVGIERAGTLNVRLLQPAPAEGLTVTVTSNDPQILAVAAPGTVTFTAGQTLRTIEVSGLTLGNATVIATGPGYGPDTLVVPVSLNLISLPPTLNVPLAQTRSLPVQLSAPAPAGGVAVALSSSNPSVARPLADTVVVAAGTQSVNATIEGLTLGSATITATNPNYALSRTVVGVTAELNITTTAVSLNGSFGSPITVRLESGGTPVAAPAGGVPLTLSSDNAGCAAIAPAATIGAGLVSTALDVIYGGVATLPCTTRLRVTGPEGFAVDSVTANVAAVPTFSRAASSIGSGLQRNIGASLSASNHGGVTVRVTSLDSSLVLVSPSATAAGTGSYETLVLPGATAIPLVISGVNGRIADTVGVRLEAAGFTTHVFDAYVWQPVYQLSSFPTSLTPLSPDDPVWVQIGTPVSPTGTAIWNSDGVRFGGGPLSATVVNDAPGVGTLVTQGGTADSITVSIAEGATNSPTSVATGGFAVRAFEQGTFTVRSVIEPFRPLAAAIASVNVEQPALSITGQAFLGSGLQRSRSLQTTGSPAPPGGTAVTVTADRPGVVQFALDATTAGVDTLIVTIPAGGTSATFWVQGVEGIVADTVTLVASADGYATGTAPQQVWQAVYYLSGLAAGGTPLTADDPFQVSIGTPSSPTSNGVWTADPRRAGQPPLAVTVVSDTPSVGILVTPEGTTVDSAVVSIAPGATGTPASVAAGGIAMRYIGAGVTRVRAVIPEAGFRPLTTAEANVTVSATALAVIDQDFLGSGLQRARRVQLSAPAPAGGVPVTVTADRAGVVLLAPDVSTVGTDTLIVTIPQGATLATFIVQALEGIVADTVTLVASSPGYVTGTAPQRVWQPTLDMSGLPSTLNTLAPDDPFTISVGTPSSPTGGTWTGDNIRTGGPPMVGTIVSSTSTVGQLTTTARTGDTVSVQIVAGTRTSPATVATGGVAFQALTTGQTIISASMPNARASGSAAGQTVTITAPAVQLSGVSTVGSGLQVGASGSVNAAQHGGIAIVVRSSNPSLFRVAPNLTTPATDSVVIPLANGATGFSYVVAAQDGVTGEAGITASAVGFTDALTTATVVAPAIQLTGLNTNQPAMANDDPFQVQIGIPVANNTTLSTAQQRRAGGDPILVTFAVSNGAVGTLVTTDVVADTLVVPIPAGSSVSPASVAAGGVAFRYLTPGTTTVRVTHPTIASTSTSSINTVNVAVPAITLGAIATVGAGLQVSASGSLNGPRHGGMDIVVRSADPSRVRVARTATDVATDSIVIPLADGVANFSYIVAGIENATGAVTITASAAGFTDGTNTANVVAPMLQITGLVTSRVAGGADDPFQVQIGIPNAQQAQLQTVQVLRAGSPLAITVTSSNAAVGPLVTTESTADSVTVLLQPGASATPSTVATGGVAFRYLTAGTSVVRVSTPTIEPTTTTGVVTVTVTP